jgi:dipeptidyl aminopeptidase/acylaminoacyl peptidase
MRKQLPILVASALLALLYPLVRVSAQNAASPEPFGIERYLNIRSATSSALSPSGHQIAFLTNISGTPQVWMVSANGGWPHQMTFFPDRVDFIAWSPDGSGLIFGKSIGGDENAQLYWMAPDGSQFRALTGEPKIRHNFGGWSPDGKKISYASNQRSRDFFDIYVMDVATGSSQLVYQQDGSNAAVAWSVDGRKLVVSHANEQLSLDNDLYLVEIATKAATHLTPHQGAAEFGNVRFMPDSHSLLFTTNDKREFRSLAQMDLSSRRIDILDDTQWDVGTVEVSDNGSRLAYTLNRDGFSELYVRQLNTDGKPLITTLGPKGTAVKLPGQGVVSGLSFSKDGGQLALVFNGARFNADVWIYDLQARTLKQVTFSARAGIPQSSFVEPELIHYKTFDERMIPAWYYRPRNAAANGSLPVIVSVHGGPEGQALPSFSAVDQYFLARGYAILVPNVRGSTGYGKTYTHLDDVQKREDSVKDLAAAVDWLKSHGGADPKRIAVMGGSYGGYMVLAAITLYPELWSSAVELFGIANFETNLQRTSGYRRKLREREYGSLEKDLEFLRSISPIYKVDRIRAPLFVLQGKNDPRVPYTESEQIVKALRDRNRPVEYILFEDEGHGFVKLNNRLLMYPKIVEFLDKHMK